MSRVIDDQSALYLVAFCSAAERYVQIIDRAGDDGLASLYKSLVDSLPALYRAAQRLPYPPGDFEDLPESNRVTHEQWQEIFDLLSSTLGKEEDLYVTVEPRGEENPPLLVGSLADDLADIYRDVKETLAHVATDEDQIAILWEARLAFWSHWGSHAVDALRIIHTQYADRRDPKFSDYHHPRD
jgi:hypothetical protein